MDNQQNEIDRSLLVSTNERLRVGVCGIGSIGFRHARLLSRRADILLYLCDSSPAQLEAAQMLPNLIESTDTFEKLLEMDLDGLVIATPDQQHVRQTEAACVKGIPVLLEKPVAESARQGEALTECHRSTGVHTLVGYSLRHNGVFLKAKDLFDSGIFGSPVSFQVMLGAYETLVLAKERFRPTDLNKLFIDYSHEWDYIHWFLGRVRRVVGTSHQSGERERSQKPNVVDCILELESGISGTVHLDYIQSPGQRCFTIIGDRGTLAIDAVRGVVAVNVYDEQFQRKYRILEHRDEMMDRQLNHFIEIIRGTHEPCVTLDDGLRALCVADALVLSCAENSWRLIHYPESSADL
jgi:predicted dehydrogenase